MNMIKMKTINSQNSNYIQYLQDNDETWNLIEELKNTYGNPVYPVEPLTYEFKNNDGKLIVFSVDVYYRNVKNLICEIMKKKIKI